MTKVETIDPDGQVAQKILKENAPYGLTKPAEDRIVRATGKSVQSITGWPAKNNPQESAHPTTDQRA